MQLLLNAYLVRRSNGSSSVRLVEAVSVKLFAKLSALSGYVSEVFPLVSRLAQAGNFSLISTTRVEAFLIS